MSRTTVNLRELENETVSAVVNHVDEEQEAAEKVYGCLDRELREREKEIPYPEVLPFDTARDYQENSDIQFKKATNKRYREAYDAQNAYCTTGNLYVGHVHTKSGKDFFILDSVHLPTKHIEDNAILINSDDKNYTKSFRLWRYPTESGEVVFSRNVSLKNRKVQDVSVILDRSSDSYADITDAFLRKTLIRNKNNAGIQSIINTIQRKQDTIRSLPAEESFVVQGCAGSGKTVVLLHRLRYLLYNKDVFQDEFCFLVPGNNFKSFIKDISDEFGIDAANIMPVQSYYQILTGVQGNVQSEDNELVFPSDFLSRVYSKDFLKDVYRDLFRKLHKAMKSLIDRCDEKLNDIVRLENERLVTQERKETDDAVISVLIKAEKAEKFIDVEISTFEDIIRFRDELSQRYEKAISEYNSIVLEDQEVIVAQDDPRIIKHPSIIELAESIADEEEMVLKASIFTAISHRNKLSKLKNAYIEAVENIRQRIVEEERALNAQRAESLSIVFGDLTLEGCAEMIKALDSIIAESGERIDSIRKQRADLTDLVAEKLHETIAKLERLIDLSANCIETRNRYVEALASAATYFDEVTSLGRDLVKELGILSNGEENEEVRFFKDQSTLRSAAYLGTLLFNACKKKIREEKGIGVSKEYKHYWYLKAYCRYLTAHSLKKVYPYVFVDEGQDISLTEYELIRKVNTTVKGEVPRFEVFGDVNQTITAHGIKDWNLLDFIPKRFLLEENFRNTNQIIAYCNESLPFKMSSVGIDMEQVDEYGSIKEYAKNKLNRESENVFIVKDDYAVRDLTVELDENAINSVSVLTVKEAKGLEFKKVTVLTRGMSDNERYIACTRALAKLCIIRDLPHHVDEKEKMYKQNDEMETEDV